MLEIKLAKLTRSTLHLLVRIFFYFKINSLVQSNVAISSVVSNRTITLTVITVPIRIIVKVYDTSLN